MTQATTQTHGADSASLKQIMDSIAGIESFKIEPPRLDPLRDFIGTTVNGDTTQDHLVIDANLAKDKKGILIYILTNVRLIKIEIDAQEIQSSSFPLETMIGVDRKLIDGTRAEVQVSFQSGSLGLRYASSNQKVTEFFQKVDQSRTQGRS